MKQIYKALSGPTLLSISSGILVLLFFSWWTNSDNTVQEIKSSNNQSLALEQMNGTAEKELLSAAAKAMMMTYNIDDEDGETIMTCGATLYDSGGPSGDYGNDEDYSVIFCADNGGQMVANLLLDNVEPNGSGGCYDYIGFYDGTSDSDPFISGHCGTGAVPAITSTGGCLFIVFSSDFNRPRSGFEVTLSCTDPPLPAGDADYLIDVEDGEIVETCSGIFSDSGDTNSDYGDDEDYTVTFCSDEDNQISFTFEHFGLDSGDELEIYDGEDTGASLLGTFSGVGEANSPGVVTSSSTCLTFAFTSDGSGSSQGWEASISCTGTPDVSASAGSWSGYSGGSCGNASTIGGTVYEDINNDGTQDARDAPIYGVTVTLFDDDGQVGSPTTTDENGEYTFGSLSDQVYRVEFTVPGDFTEGPYGAGSGTAVQFVEPGVCADLGLVDVVHYCGDTNPFFVIPCYVNGDPQDDQNVIQTGIAGFEYTDSGNSPAPTYENYVTAGAVGTIWGTAYDGNTEKLYMSTFLKRHAGLGPDGIGAIYMHTDGAANTSAPVFYDFGAAAGDGRIECRSFSGKWGWIWRRRPLWHL